MSAAQEIHPHDRFRARLGGLEAAIDANKEEVKLISGPNEADPVSIIQRFKTEHRRSEGLSSIGSKSVMGCYRFLRSGHEYPPILRASSVLQGRTVMAVQPSTLNGVHVQPV